MNYLLLILCVGGAAFAQKLQLAVMPLEPKGIPAHEAELLSESLLGHLQVLHTYQIIERTQVSLILAEQGFQQSGACTGGSCAVEVGRLLSADRILVGSVGLLGNRTVLNLRIVDVGSGLVQAQCQRETDQGSAGILPLLANVAAELTGAPPIPYSAPVKTSTTRPMPVFTGTQAIYHLNNPDSVLLEVHAPKQYADTAHSRHWTFPDVLELSPDKPESLWVYPGSYSSYPVVLNTEAGDWDLVLPAKHTDSAWTVYDARRDKASDSWVASTLAGVAIGGMGAFVLYTQDTTSSSPLLFAVGSVGTGIVLGAIISGITMKGLKPPPEDRKWHVRPHVIPTSSSVAPGLQAEHRF